MIKTLLTLTAWLMANLATINFEKNDTIFFISLNYAIHQGQYDGIARVGDIRDKGDFGLGSEEKLAGELIVLDGKFYSVNSKGVARIMQDNDLIAFAALKKFETDKRITLERISDIKMLEEQLSQLINHNAFAAIKIHGTFDHIQLRSFEEQQKPYRPVDEVPEIKFERKNISGTLVGSYTPESAQVMNSPVFHFHFIDDARATGGHVLDCDLRKASVEIDLANSIHIQLPDTTVTEHLELNEPIQQKH